MNRLSAQDLSRLAARGISAREAERQLDLLAHPPAPARLVRPAMVGDGIERFSNARLEELAARGRAARNAGRLTKFVPASGAATRMFRSLMAVREKLPGATLDRLVGAAEAGDAEAREAVAFVAALPRLALAQPLATILARRVDELTALTDSAPLEPLVSALLDSRGLDAERLPKALLPFHALDGATRSAFIEQLAEGLGYLVDTAHRARYHFTVPPGWRDRFEAELEQARGLLPEELRLEVGFSEQSPATDTLALASDGSPARSDDGGLLLRPAGHGSLLGNLEATGGDLVVVKNIDNVLPARRHAEIARWQLVLAGFLCELEERTPHRELPLRVCGVVPNTGEPGGGPFWVSDPDGVESLQIVESSQVDHRDAEQRAAWSSSTHFNPVDLVAALRDDAGRPFALDRFVDPSAAFVTRKSEGGRELVVLERPGLWNGSMARWETRFVELPGWTFAPVKTVLDLARGEHALA